MKNPTKPLTNALKNKHFLAAALYVRPSVYQPGKRFLFNNHLKRILYNLMDFLKFFLRFFFGKLNLWLKQDIQNE